MCYSAEAWSLFDAFRKEFPDVEIDIKAFWETYLGRDEKYRIRKKASDATKIPKGMDYNFLHPEGELEQQIHDMIQQWNGQRISESEQELFKQVKRVADAERKLKVKETKKALDDVRIGNNKIVQMKRWIADAKRSSPEPEKDNRIFPDWYAPVLLMQGGKLTLKPMRYHCRPEGMDPSIDRSKTGQVSGTYNARRDNLTRFWCRQFGYTHALMVADTFYENVDDGKGGSKEIHFRPRTGEPMFIACLYSHWTDTEGKEPDLWSFAALTDEPEEQVARAGHDRTVINLKRENVDAWLNPDPNNLQALLGLMDDKQHPYYEVIRKAA
jgi:putative SOS response-associated peptidase YedK